MKSVLIHVRDNSALENYIYMIKNNYNSKVAYSEEVRYLIEEFFKNNWIVYLTTIHNFENNVWRNVYCVNEDKKTDMNIIEVNNYIDFMIIRNLGSVEGNFKLISEYLDFIIDNYKGVVLNNPIAMKKGMTKNYLAEIDSKELKNIGILTIPTKIYDNKLKFNQIMDEYSNPENYLIKPSTGELSNSLQCLKNIDEKFLRDKENKVGGWVIQPIKNEIWNGEYQLVFIGDKLIYSQKKLYPNASSSTIPNQKSRIIEKYNPSQSEVNVMKNVIKYFKILYDIHIDICRIDFMKDISGQPILIEFEMVNPGFFIRYMKEDIETISNIVKEIRYYCENFNKKNSLT